MSRSAALLSLLLILPARADDATDALAKELRDYATAELAKVPGKDGKYSTALPDYLRHQIQEANRRDREAWVKVKTRADWEVFRDERIRALRESLGTFPEVPKQVPVRVTRTIDGGDYAIDNLLYESRPGVWVAGNLYRPAKPRDKMPVFLIAHAHHAPKHQGELQDMGVTWAKLGCMVLVIDQLGHGERRQHPFHTAKDFPREFKPSRQDYYFRYNLNLQLSLVGDSLMGWMAWDLMRGLDVVLARPGADTDRVILLGAVAGGGDPAAVTAALDPRFTCVVPFNFGGPQPETRYPLPEDAETWFNYAGSGSWESTRNLRDSAAKGFLPWVIVASVAPRKLIHAHEFSWDRDRDPVWKRYQKVWGFYDATDNVSFTTGTGQIQINDARASHCTNIGPIQRKGIYAALKTWYGIPVPEKESQERRSADELRCWTPEAEKELKPKPLHEVLAARSVKPIERAHAITQEFKPGDRDDHLSTAGRALFDRGWWAAYWMKEVRVQSNPVPQLASCKGERLDIDHPIPYWAVLLRPKDTRPTARIPIAVCICQDGPNVFLRDRSPAVAALLRSGTAVCLPELAGMGPELQGDGRGRTSAAASRAAGAWMNGETVVGLQWRQLESLVRLLAGKSVEPNVAIGLWGESFAEPNRPGDRVEVPHDLPQPRLAQPAAGLLATFVGMGDKRVKAVAARGVIVSYRSVLDSPFVHVPSDVFPVGDGDCTDGVFQVGDLPEAWASLPPKSLRLEGLVDGTNRRVPKDKLGAALRPVTEAYKKGGLVVRDDYTPDAELAKWIVEQLRK